MFGNHNDIPATVLDMLPGFSPKDFTFYWSEDLFLKQLASGVEDARWKQYAEGFAYYTNENGLGWATPRGKGFYEFGSREWRIFEGKLDEADRIMAQAYLQTLYNDFLRK